MAHVPPAQAGSSGILRMCVVCHVLTDTMVNSEH